MAEHPCLCAGILRNALVRAASSIKWLCSRWERGIEGEEREREIGKARVDSKGLHKLVDEMATCREGEVAVTDKEERYRRALKDIRQQLKNHTGGKFSRVACALNIAETAVDTDLEWECLT